MAIPPGCCGPLALGLLTLVASAFALLASAFLGG